MEQEAATSPRAEQKDALLFIRRLPRQFVIIPPLLFVVELGVMYLLDLFMPKARPSTQAIFDSLLLTVIVCGPLWLLVMRPLAHALAAEREAVATKQAMLRAEMHRQQFEAALQRALEMATSEGDAIRVLRRALIRVADLAPISLMVADSSQAHLREVVAVRGKASAEPIEDGREEENDPICPVDYPNECIATRHGRTAVYNDSEAIDACPCLGRSAEAVAAACIPISIAGKTIGVLHTRASRNTPISDRTIAGLRIIASQAGARLGVIRTLAAVQLAATTDPLTGLLNRRSLEEKVALLLAADRHFTVVMADLDHFKKLNDTHSHAVGDRALKVFARCLKDCCRGEDLVGRLGGEEFVVVLPDVEADRGAAVMERVRASLPAAQMNAGVPPFTASFGVADRHNDAEFDGILRAADHALYAAKQAGRNLVALAEWHCRSAGGEPEPAARTPTNVSAASGALFPAPPDSIMSEGLLGR